MRCTCYLHAWPRHDDAHQAAAVVSEETEDQCKLFHALFHNMRSRPCMYCKRFLTCTKRKTTLKHGSLRGALLALQARNIFITIGACPNSFSILSSRVTTHQMQHNPAHDVCKCSWSCTNVQRGVLLVTYLDISEAIWQWPELIM